MAQNHIKAKVLANLPTTPRPKPIDETNLTHRLVPFDIRSCSFWNADVFFQVEHTKVKKEVLSPVTYLCISNEKQAAAVVLHSYHSNAFPQSLRDSVILIAAVGKKSV